MAGLYRCPKCLDEKTRDEIMQLQCSHRYCLKCMDEYFSEKVAKSVKDINCPNCNEPISDDKIRCIISDFNIERYDSICNKNLPQTFRCLLPGCKTMVEYEDENCQYTCPNCTLFNCICCQASHIDISCHQYENAKTAYEDLCRKEMDRAQCVLSQKRRKDIEKALNCDLFTNKEVFTCEFCNYCIAKTKGIRMRNCGDLVCRTCLISHIKETKIYPVQCPWTDCVIEIEDREIKEILKPDEYELYEKKSKNFIKSLLHGTFQCQAPDCDYFCEVLDSNVIIVICRKCGSKNCVPCRAIHENEKCSEYQLRIKSTDIDKNNKKMEEQISQGKYMKCPGCQTLIQNEDSCNLISCSHCRMELCWAKKTSRWGPKGRGDESGGCQCMVKGELCDPSCGGCKPKPR